MGHSCQTLRFQWTNKQTKNANLLNMLAEEYSLFDSCFMLTSASVQMPMFLGAMWYFFLFNISHNDALSHTKLSIFNLGAT